VVRNAREEVVNGEIRLMPPNKLPHADIVQNLTAAFAAQLDRKQVSIYGSTFGLVVRQEPLTCRVPDLALFLRSRMVVKDGFIHSAPELAVEVLSPSETRRERLEK